ncbi:ScbR family autoregulator-binding transcription factor [Streptomyces sp. NPDC000594]|uniref:ScbR family autoregulator-binding transcription factor n=1 Tax=Streptomyces sp. NPDC000594 TaxID=3154261 RepID=UPI00331B722A
MTKQQRAVRTRRSLIRSAAEAFERYGYAQAKLADISSSAGVSAGALHFHFENKAAVATTVEATAGTLLRRAAVAAQRPPMNALQRLTNVSHALADTLREDVVARAGFRLSCEASRPAGPNLRREWQECVADLLTEAERERLLPPDLVQEDMVTAIVGATTGFEILGRQDPEWFSPRALASFWRIILPCLATPEALPELDPAGTSRPPPPPEGSEPGPPAAGSRVTVPG